MPTSWHEAIPNIMNKIEQLKPKSILDIGVGFGKYGVILRELLDIPYERFEKDTWSIQIDGVEAFTDYQNPLHKYVYNHVYYENIIDLVDRLDKYDVILMIDVLEHFEKNVGIALLKALTKITKKAIIISTPQYPAPQDEYLGNRFEMHRSRWTNLDFVDFDFTFDLLRVKENYAQIFAIFPPEKKSIQLSIDEASSKTPSFKKRLLTIGYFLPHQYLTGGLKMLLEQMKHLRNNGHKIVVFYRGDEKGSVIPNWYDLTVDQEIVVPSNESFLPYVDGCDIGIAGWLEQIPELSKAKIPILYWEQGNEWIFGEDLTPERRAYLQECFSNPVSLASVSPLISKSLKARYNRQSTVIPNGIDIDFYHPGQPLNDNVILLVGNPYLPFKGFDVAIRTLLRIWKKGHRFKVKWICQSRPELDDIPFPFPIEYIVNPKQTELAMFYQKSDIFLFTSWYEGFGMPPLEAMASGTPVVSTRCGGVEVYAKNGVNSILADPGDIEGLANGVISLLTNSEERKRLSKNGRSTALEFSSSNMIQRLEQLLIHLVESKKG